MKKSTDDRQRKHQLLLTTTLLFLIASALFLSSCAGIKSEQVPTINGNNNTITINQTPSVDKASKTEIDAAGSGYGDVR